MTDHVFPKSSKLFFGSIQYVVDSSLGTRFLDRFWWL